MPGSIAKSLAVVALAAGVLAAGGAPAAAPYDGAWSVLIITDKGDCDRAFRYGVQVQNGAVRLNETSSPVAVSGRVASNGSVRVSLNRGNQRADGTGKLNSARGSGTWKGSATGTACSGRWEAEKR